MSMPESTTATLAPVPLASIQAPGNAVFLEVPTGRRILGRSDRKWPCRCGCSLQPLRPVHPGVSRAFSGGLAPWPPLDFSCCYAGEGDESHPPRKILCGQSPRPADDGLLGALFGSRLVGDQQLSGDVGSARRGLRPPSVARRPLPLPPARATGARSPRAGQRRARRPGAHQGVNLRKRSTL